MKGGRRNRLPSEKSPSGISDFDVSMDRTIRKTNRTQSASDPGEDQTDRLQNQKVRESLQKDRMFNLPSLELEGKARGEILRARFSMQKTRKEEAMDRCFEQSDRGENHAGLLQNHPSRFSMLAGLLLERRVRDPILQGLAEEQEDLFSIQTDRF